MRFLSPQAEGEILGNGDAITSLEAQSILGAHPPSTDILANNLFIQNEAALSWTQIQ